MALLLVQEFGWLAHYARGGSGVDYNEAQLRKQKWSVASRVVKKAMRHRRAAVQARDSTACGDCTQTLLRMTPGQGMAPDGFAGETSLYRDEILHCDCALSQEEPAASIIRQLPGWGVLPDCCSKDTPPKEY